MVLRALLGTEMVLIVVALPMYCGMLVFAGYTVTNSAGTLFRHATHQAAMAARRTEPGRRRATVGAPGAHEPALPVQRAEHGRLARAVRPASRRACRREPLGCAPANAPAIGGSIGTVAEEIEYVRAYVTLEQERWGRRLRVEWDVDDASRSRSLPPLVLQPLVENALAHGIGSRLTGGTIWITVRAGDSLMIRVKDDGPGFPALWNDGTGLGNLRERLQAIYGERATLDVDSDADGAQVTVTLPSADDATRTVRA